MPRHLAYVSHNLSHLLSSSFILIKAHLIKRITTSNARHEKWFTSYCMYIRTHDQVCKHDLRNDCTELLVLYCTEYSFQTILHFFSQLN